MKTHVWSVVLVGVLLSATSLAQTARKQVGLSEQELRNRFDGISTRVFNPVAGLHAKFRVIVALSQSSTKDERYFDGIYELILAGESESLTAEFEKSPARARERGFLPKQVLYRDPTQLVWAFPGSRQAVVLESGPIPLLIHPWDLLSPYERSSLSRLAERSNSVSASVRDNGDIHFSMSLPSEGQAAPPTVTGVLSAAADFALTEWSCNATGRTCHLEYAPGDDSHFPVRAALTFNVSSCGGGLLESITLETLETGAVADIPSNPISQGFVVHDVRESRPDASLEYYTVGPQGEKEPISVVETEPVATTSVKLTSGALVAVFVCGIASLRFRLASQLTRMQEPRA